jgi:hypothetical protein
MVLYDRLYGKPFSAPAYGCKTGEIRGTRLYYLLTQIGSGRRNIIFSGAWRVVLTKYCRCRVLLDSEGGVFGVGGRVRHCLGREF